MLLYVIRILPYRGSKVTVCNNCSNYALRLVDICKIWCLRYLCSLLHARNTPVSPENKYTKVCMDDDDYYNLDTRTGVCGECWDIIIDENSDRFLIKMSKYVYTS